MASEKVETCPTVPLDCQPNDTGDTQSNELEIIWLHPPERYAYLRESIAGFAQRRSFPKSMRPGNGNTDGGPDTHLVAYTVLKPGAASSCGRFNRPYWWVKTYDRFEGHGTDRSGSFYATGGPVEAVLPHTVQVNKPSTAGWNE